MENLRVKVSNESESKEVQELFIALGATCGVEEITSKWVCLCDGQITFYDLLPNVDFKKITLQELRDMVILMQNNPKDANVYQDGDIQCLYDLYLTESEELYFYHCGKKAWILSTLNHNKDYYELLKPIKEETMKEYLVKTDSGKYRYTGNVIDVSGGAVIEIPEWGNYAYSNDTGVYFLKDEARYSQSSLVWQRESLNDKIATAEVARQEEKHSHYKKYVSHLNVIDPYRIADLYDLHPCADHIMKKSLCAGNRGHKDTLRDIQDIIDTAERWKQMIEEDNGEI